MCQLPLLTTYTGVGVCGFHHFQCIVAHTECRALCAASRTFDDALHRRGRLELPHRRQGPRMHPPHGDYYRCCQCTPPAVCYAPHWRSFAHALAAPTVAVPTRFTAQHNPIKAPRHPQLRPQPAVMPSSLAIVLAHSVLCTQATAFAFATAFTDLEDTSSCGAEVCEQRFRRLVSSRQQRPRAHGLRAVLAAVHRLRRLLRPLCLRGVPHLRHRKGDD